jgi:hypothetical protein
MRRNTARITAAGQPAGGQLLVPDRRPLTVEPTLKDGEALAPPGSQETAAQITLEPFGIKVFPIIRDI